MKFEDYKLPYGYPLTLEGSTAGGEPFKFSSRLVGCMPGEFLLVTLPKAARSSSLRAGQKILVKIMAANGILAFATQVDQLQAQPRPIVVLAYPKRLSFKEIRGATRIEVNLPLVARASKALTVEESAGAFSDISILGARVALATAIAEVGTVINLRAPVELLRYQGELNIDAVVRARVERSTQEQEAGHPAVYGVEFVDMEEKQRLLLYAWVYSIMAQA